MSEKVKYIYIGLILLFLAGCRGALPLSFHDNAGIKFSPDKGMFLKTGPEIVDLSTRLKQKLIMAKFIMTDRIQEAGYILTFDYKARFDVYPWVFNSLNIKIEDSATGDVLYTVTSDSSGAEGVDSVLSRTVDEMARRLITDRDQSKVFLKVIGAGNGAVKSEH